MNEAWQEKLVPFLEERLNAYLEMLREMVLINSFTQNPPGIDKHGQQCADFFAALGFAAEFIPSVRDDYGHHTILTREGKGPHQILMISHLDTVYSAEEEHDNDFSWREDGDRIYGPGTMDIKGGTVMIYMVLDALRSLQPELFEQVTWRVLLDASEEDDARDFGGICQRMAGPETLAALVFEAGKLDDEEFLLVVARKGRAVFQVHTEGRASHAGVEHEKGASAIRQMMDAIQRIEAVTDYERDLTVNVGYVRGGSVTNRVPHVAEARLEMRAFRPEVYADGRAKILALDGLSSIQSPADEFAAKTQVVVERETGPWPPNPRTERLFGLWEEAGVVFGRKAVRQERGGVSDGNFLFEGAPVIDGLGPAGANAHCSEQSDDGSKEQEYAVRSSFVPKAAINVHAIAKLIAETS